MRIVRLPFVLLAVLFTAAGRVLCLVGAVFGGVAILMRGRPPSAIPPPTP